MLREVLDPNDPISEKVLAEFERRHNLNLPTIYREFLLQYNGGQPIPAVFPIMGFPNNPTGALQAFFGINAKIATEDLDVVLTGLAGLVPSGLIPIACTEGDDFVCMDLRKEADRMVYWHRKPFWGNEIWREEYLYPVADSFQSFLTMLNVLQDDARSMH